MEFQNIKIDSVLDKKTSQDKPYKACEVITEDGGVYKVNIWSDFPDFANLKVGSVVRAKLEQKGQYWNILSETQAKPRGGASGAYKEKVIGEAMERKEKSISSFQDNKEFSIKVASTMSGAVALAVAEYKDKTILDTLDKAVLKWREFLWRNWDVDPKDYPPFE